MLLRTRLYLTRLHYIRAACEQKDGFLAMAFETKTDVDKAFIGVDSALQSVKTEVRVLRTLVESLQAENVALRRKVAKSSWFEGLFSWR